MNGKPDGPELFDQIKTRYEELKHRLPPGINDVSSAVIGAAIEVHRHLGPGFLENAYEETLCYELTLRGIKHTRQVVLPIVYKQTTTATFQLDLLVEDCLAVELKAVTSFLPIHKAQLLSYLKAGRFKLGLLINFNALKLRDGVVRVIDTPDGSL